ncbi:hypothetical protein [Methylobacterium trifolii]|uniref:Uncharacterized protein n=1 Tax=Methylobacterium trifolii TaxID=1003092 RepID=A0ABQ4U6E5_9HYPH|nr:hypothetical protein [Methylobacterium trifolii]GJE62747.1 hypothetical protein MPOCJGCO_4882 [Methylobacterium trifolii]
MKTRIAAVVTALVLGVAPISSAMAYSSGVRYGAPAWTYDVEDTGSIGAPAGGFYSRNPATCSMSSAAEGNARQQNFPVQQYGQTAGGNRC